MADWPTGYFGLPAGTINPMSQACLLHGQSGINNFTTSAVWPAANRAIYIPFFLEQALTAYHMGISVSVQSGFVDVGIYDDNGVRLVSSGSTAVAAAGIQRFNIPDTVLTPGVYYMAMSVDNITFSCPRALFSEPLAMEATGLRIQNLGSVTLPNPATFATPATAHVPLLAIALNPTF